MMPSSRLGNVLVYLSALGVRSPGTTAKGISLSSFLAHRNSPQTTAITKADPWQSHHVQRGKLRE